MKQAFCLLFRTHSSSYGYHTETSRPSVNEYSLKEQLNVSVSQTTGPKLIQFSFSVDVKCFGAVILMENT